MTGVPVYPRTGTFFQYVPLSTRDPSTGIETPYAGAFQVCLLAYNADPPAVGAGVWLSSTTLGSLKGVMITGQTPGVKRVWAHPTGISGEDPVIDCGVVLVT